MELKQHVFHPLLDASPLAEEHHGIRGQVVRAACGVRVDQVQVAVQAAYLRSVPEPLRVSPEGLDQGVPALFFGVLHRQLFQLVRKMGRAAGGQPRQHLRRRQQQRRGDVFRPPLGAGVKGPQRVDLIVKELAPYRFFHQRREHVQDAAPEGELPHALHLVAAGVARLKQLGGQFLQVRPAAGLQSDGQRRQPLGRHGPGQEGVHRGDHHRGIPRRHLVQGRQAAPLPLPGRDGVGPELPLPGQQRHRDQPGEALQVPRQLAGLPLVGAEEHHGPSGPGGHRRADAGPLHRLCAGEDSGASAVFHPADEFRNLRQSL